MKRRFLVAEVPYDEIDQLILDAYTEPDGDLFKDLPAEPPEPSALDRLIFEAYIGQVTRVATAETVVVGPRDDFA